MRKTNNVDSKPVNFKKNFELEWGQYQMLTIIPFVIFSKRKDITKLKIPNFGSRYNLRP